jgi:hypothetical protein
MLRAALLAFGGLILAGGAFVSVATNSASGLPAALVGGGLILALLIERHRYKHIRDAPPGPDWQPTGELFFEPDSEDTQVTVYFQPGTGKRSYVRRRRP